MGTWEHRNIARPPPPPPRPPPPYEGKKQPGCNRRDVTTVAGFARDLIECNGGHTYVGMLGFVVPESCSSVP
jgi:hypothetical protein